MNHTEDYAPDTSVLTDPIVSEALSALRTDARLAETWGRIPSKSWCAHQAILKTYLAFGEPPCVSDFSAETLSDLEQRDLVHVRDGKIAFAYPFSTQPTDFQVRVGGTKIYAICAVDALGTAGMARRATELTCVCPICRASLSIGISPDGLTVKHASASNPRVWTGVNDVGTCAAQSLCRSMLLFCTPEHLDTWKQSQPQSARGFDLSLAQGAQLGAAIFRPFMNTQTNKAAT